MQLQEAMVGSQTMAHTLVHPQAWVSFESTIA